MTNEKYLSAVRAFQQAQTALWGKNGVIIHTVQGDDTGAASTSIAIFDDSGKETRIDFRAEVRLWEEDVEADHVIALVRSYLKTRGVA